MNQFWAISFAFGIVALGRTPVEAGGCCRQECAPPPCAVTVTYVDKVVTCYRPQWVEKDISCTVMRTVTREVVEQRKCTVMVPEWKDEKRTIHIYKSVPKEVEREITCARYAPRCATGCAGCGNDICNTCKPEYYTVKVKSIVCEDSFEAREIVARVCTYRSEQRTYDVRRCVVESHPETVVQKVRECVMVAYETTVKVAVCAPAECCK